MSGETKKRSSVDFKGMASGSPVEPYAAPIDEDGSFASSQSSNPFPLSPSSLSSSSKRPTRIELLAYPYGDRVRLEAVLMDTNGTRLANKPIDFYYGDPLVDDFEYGPWYPIDQRYTSYEGRAVIETDVHKWYAAEFLGDDVYEGYFATIRYNPSASPPPSPSPSPSPLPSPGPSPLPSPSPSPSSGECCGFADFGCWFFRQGKCVKIFDMAVDSMVASMLLVAVILVFLVLIVL